MLTLYRARHAPFFTLSLSRYFSCSSSQPTTPSPKPHQPLPKWLKITQTPSSNPDFIRISNTLKSLKLTTVCEEAKCPNLTSCWGDKSAATATIMLMGDECTRACRFCHVKTSRKPMPLDVTEPIRVAAAVKSWGLSYIVLTSVDRDDLTDYGAKHFADTIKEILKVCNNETGRVVENSTDKTDTSGILVEALVPDFAGNKDCIRTVVDSGLHVFAHNVETVERLTPEVRDPRAKYRQSLDVLKLAKEIGGARKMLTKSSVMLGFGEKDSEVRQTMEDLRTAGVDVITFGQYLRPAKRFKKVVEFVPPEKFDYWKDVAEKEMGFKYCASGPLVRSSYKAGEYYIKNIIQGNEGSSTAESVAVAG